MNIPQGWKLVPIEPTDEMIHAACVSWPTRPGQRVKRTAGDYAREDWRAFLASAPLPPEEPRHDTLDARGCPQAQGERR